MVRNYVNEKIGANYMRKLEAVGGWIYFDETGLTFKSHTLLMYIEEKHALNMLTSNM